VEALTLWLLPDERADGPHHMAADEVMLQSAADGTPSLRFYTWLTPTLSLGYFQNEADRLTDSLLAELPFVRRPSGGGALVHHHELTYCLAVPARFGRGMDWLRMHEVIAAALAELGVHAGLHIPRGEEHAGHFLCFHDLTAGDLVIGDWKIGGSAQRKQRGAVLQHGGILLARSDLTPTLPGILELSGVAVPPRDLSAAIVNQATAALGWRVAPGGWTPAETQRIAELVRTRYRNDAWNRKR
jgi:lipoate-protein ligase A